MPDADTETPLLHLSLSGDARVNANWEKIDRALGALEVFNIIPGNLQVQGDLDVTGDASVAGTLTAGHLVSPLADLQAVQVTGSLGVATGPVSLPAGSLSGAELAPGGSVQGSWIGAVSSGGSLNGNSTTPQQLATLLTDVSEETTRWDLVFGSVTLQLGLNTDPGTAVPVAMNVQLTRGTFPGTMQQSRNFGWTLARAGFFQVPITLVRIAKPPTVTDEARWNIALVMTTTAALIQMTNIFGQLQVVQLR